ncbi:MAG: hypothetical protein HY910_17675 [Desulfarculus sp.]|nr:hypothetical protein [Desulfarculus sp.]
MIHHPRLHHFKAQSPLALWPAGLVLAGTLAAAYWGYEFSHDPGPVALGQVLFRSLRLGAALILPLLVLAWLCTLAGKALNRPPRRLIRMQEPHGVAHTRVQTWLLRPLQGIGLAMLLLSRVLAAVRIYRGDLLHAADIPGPGQADPWLHLSGVAILACSSLVLCLLWTLDDLGIRLHNQKTGEVRLLGRYLGLLLPLLVGMYGFFSIFDEHSHVLALDLIGLFSVVLYPPLVLLVWLHGRYLARRQAELTRRLGAKVRLLEVDQEEEAAG